MPKIGIEGSLINGCKESLQVNPVEVFMIQICPISMTFGEGIANCKPARQLKALLLTKKIP
jgi:hypothetical protein